MIENRPWLTIFSHTMLILGIAVILFPLYVAFVAATLDKQEVYAAPMTLIPGTHLLENIHNIWVNGVGTNSAPFWRMLLNSFVMAFSITLGKITVSMLSAFAIVWFRFPLRNLFFWMIFITLMLPVEVRIFPTVEVIANLKMLDSYAGLTLPLMASATATFLFRQFFMTLPDELVEAAQQAAPELPRGLLLDEWRDDWRELTARLGCVSIHLNHKLLDKARVMQLKDAGLRILVYTVNKPQRAAELLRWGVDCICTDAIDVIGPNFTAQ